MCARPAACWSKSATRGQLGPPAIPLRVTRGLESPVASAQPSSGRCLEGGKGLSVSGPRAVSAAVPFRSNGGWGGMFAMQRGAGGGRAAGSGGLGGAAGQAPQLSNRPGPAGSCNSRPSRLFPPCRLPPPAACQAVGAACALGPAEGGSESRGQGWREGLPGRGREGVQAALPAWPREGRVFAQGHTGSPTELGHTLIQPFCSRSSRTQLDAAWRSCCHSDEKLWITGSFSHLKAKAPSPGWLLTQA